MILIITMIDIQFILIQERKEVISPGKKKKIYIYKDECPREINEGHSNSEVRIP